MPLPDNIELFIPCRPVAQRQPRMENPAYLRSFKGRECEACGALDATVVGAHVREGMEGGMGLKPGDALVVALCAGCHREQGDHPGADWWMGVFKQMLRRRYMEWVLER